MRNLAKRTMIAGACLALAGCTNLGPMVDARQATTNPLPIYPQKTQTQQMLGELPAPRQPVSIAVYNFTDQTGSYRTTDAGGQTLSRSVTQGGASILVRALQDAGAGSWFTIVEREQLRNLLSERQIIREMRERYLGETGVNPQALPAMLFAGVLLEGGIISYDTNTVTGGAGAAFLGIGGRTEYRQDTVTVYLRAVSVRTGEVLTTVTASKTIASQALGGSAFRYIAFKELLEAEAGYTVNEPDHLALQQAIEKAVYGLIMEGIGLNLWNFKDADAGWPMLWRYRQERDGHFTPQQVQAAMEQSRKAPAMRSRPAEPANGDAELSSTSRKAGGQKVASASKR